MKRKEGAVTHQSGRKYLNKLYASMLLQLVLLIIIPVLAYVFLFHTNTFSVEVRPCQGDHTVISAGEEFSDPGAEVYLVGSIIVRKGFRIDAEVTSVLNLDTGRPGEYTVTYSAHWAGMDGLGYRTVSVQDTAAPSITLRSIPGHYTLLGQTYQEEGFSAWDDCDGDLTPYVTRLNDGEYVTYIVVDKAGNRTSVSRKIRYHDPVAPEILLLGETTLTVKAGEDYSEPGWTVMDNVDGDLTGSVRIQGQVDKYRAGTYQLTYSVRDETGNVAEAVRNIVVQPIGIESTVSPEGKVIYLTFDDGPGPYTRKLLEVLEKYGAKATFFVVDSEYNDVMKDIVAGGHSIGIHSVTHDYGTVYESPEAFFRDILSMQEIIYEETGVRTYLMRFPGGSSNTVSRFNEGIMTYLTQAVEDCGFRYFDWNVDSDDAGSTRKSEKVFDNVIAGVRNRRVSVVLQHDIKEYSVAAVEKILIWGLENGYRFLALDTNSPMAHHGVNN